MHMSKILYNNLLCSTDLVGYGNAEIPQKHNTLYDYEDCDYSLESSKQIIIVIKKMLVFLIVHELFYLDCKKVVLVK